MEKQLDLSEYEPHYPVTDDNHAAYVVVPSLVFFAYAILAVIAKNVLRFKWTTVKLHDVVLIISTLLLIAQTACVVLSCESGLGSHLDSLSKEQIRRFNQVGRSSIYLLL
ncbi:hypothetical protein PG994_015117 [Apiospora phragmitis]|uniref:Uncharacterized protein n=1 Tax=Apiospora phragmitis TaxID=2905665 RepID=A0ABR1SVK2_9PEZI